MAIEMALKGPWEGPHPPPLAMGHLGSTYNPDTIALVNTAAHPISSQLCLAVTRHLFYLIQDHTVPVLNRAEDEMFK